VLILETTKGKGVSFMENNVDFHGVPPNEMERNQAIKELDLLEKRLEAKL
jgi:transketolase